MEKIEPRGLSATGLADLGVLRAQGPDAVKFLQGQLSNDITRLAAAGFMLAGLHNPQGRVVALLRLVSLGADDVLAIAPRELIAPVIARLSKYLLRAKVKITDASADWRVTGIRASGDWRPEAHQRAAHIEGGRWWLVTEMAEDAMLPGAAVLDRDSWRALDIAAGIPQVYVVTSEEFVAQMLNLDELGGIAFDKGCYTGQEVIARAHYRGRVKRRIQRFRLPQDRVAPGDSGTLPDGRSFKVVEAVARADGGSDVLAVAALTTSDESSEGPS
jgi:tRNA-modifying protein YgfZ